jgi:hypothetical protein
MKCAVCRQRTKEFLVVEPVPKQFLFFKWKGAKVERLCREHLIQRFREEFTKATQRMVVFYPNLEEKHGGYQYSYVLARSIKKGFGPAREMDVRVSQQVADWLGMITGRCSRCSYPAGVAYFRREAITWQRVPDYLAVRFDYPMIHHVTETPEILCRRCAFENIERSLRAEAPGFEDGILCPYGTEEGVYVTVEI